MLISNLNRTTSPDGKTQFIDATDLTLTRDMLPGMASVVIRADIVRVAGTITLPGQNLSILARILVCGNPTSISTAGSGVIGSYPNQKAGPGASNGANGNGGSDGQAGGDGGNITIVVGSLIGPLSLDSSGQSGGDAESGGDGAAGQPGQDWSKDSGLVAGGNGGNGGQGGMPGKPGNGGNAGNITFLSIQPLSPDQLTTTSAKGFAGTPGTYGNFGAAGSGGQGGTLIQPVYGVCYY